MRYGKDHFALTSLRASILVSLIGELNEVSSFVVIQWIKLYHSGMPSWHSMVFEFNGHRVLQ